MAYEIFLYFIRDNNTYLIFLKKKQVMNFSKFKYSNWGFAYLPSKLKDLLVNALSVWIGKAYTHVTAHSKFIKHNMTNFFPDCLHTHNVRHYNDSRAVHRQRETMMPLTLTSEWKFLNKLVYPYWRSPCLSWKL